MISPGRLWLYLRRDFERGLAATRHDYFTLPQITRWRLPTGAREHSVPMHILTGQKDWQLAGWMLASFFHFTGGSWPLTVHDDGTLPQEAREFFAGFTPRLRIVSRAEADAAMEPKLAAFPRCLAYRRAHPLALKIFDAPHFAAEGRFMIFDSDVLYFARPDEILAWAESANAGTWFNADVADSTLVTAEEAQRLLGVTLQTRVNSGLCLLESGLVDLAFCERALAETDILQGHIWRVEQTLFALCASRAQAGGLLPPTYEVSLSRWAQPDAISRHYVGAVRDRFYAEGLARLRPVLLGRQPCARRDAHPSSVAA